MENNETFTVSVVGLGKMGGDWVVNLLEAGHKVIGYENNDKTLDSLEDRLKQGLGWLAKKKYPNDSSFVDNAYQRFHLANRKVDFVELSQESRIFLEVIYEDLEVKCKLFEEFIPQLPSNLVVWTNTSSLSIGTMAQASGRPGQFIGTHGMNPVYQMPAVEVIQHKNISPSSLSFTLKTLTEMGKMPFTASDVPGFWVNKQLVPYLLESMRALERGEITVADGDRGMKGSLGHPQGVFKLCDFIGNDTLYRVAVAMYLATQDPRYYPPFILARLYKSGHWGVKSGQGFYTWDKMKAVEEVDFSTYQFVDANTLLEI